MKCIEMDCNNKRIKNKVYCKDCEEFVLSEIKELKECFKQMKGGLKE